MKAATFDIVDDAIDSLFQSTPPVKAATMSKALKARHYAFQSTPPVKAATKLSYLAIRGEGISIHAAREGGDATD